MTPKFTLIPSEIFSPDGAREILSKVVPLETGEPLSFIELPVYQAVFVYAGEQRPLIYEMISSLFKIREHNKILISVKEGCLNLVIAEDDRLLLCNCFPVIDFVTAEYYIFSSLKQLQINPEISTVYSMEPLESEQVISLCSYFKNAEVLR